MFILERSINILKISHVSWKSSCKMLNALVLYFHNNFFRLGNNHVNIRKKSKSLGNFSCVSEIQLQNYGCFGVGFHLRLGIFKLMLEISINILEISHTCRENSVVKR